MANLPDLPNMTPKQLLSFRRQLAAGRAGRGRGGPTAAAMVTLAGTVAAGVTAPSQQTVGHIRIGRQISNRVLEIISFEFCEQSKFCSFFSIGELGSIVPMAGFLKRDKG